MEKLLQIQSLRAIAAIAVVVYHAQLSARTYDIEVFISGFYHFYPFGAVGVDIFFVISGFIMVHVSHQLHQQPGGASTFLIKRIIRIVPAYWFFTTVYVFLLLLIPSAFNAAEFDLSHTVLSYLFLPATNQASGSYFPVLLVGWTLNYEMYFYLVFAFLLLFSRKVFLPALTLYFVSTSILGYFRTDLNTGVGFYLNPIVLEFLFGCCIALVFQSGIRVSANLCLLALVAGLAGLFLTILFGTPEQSYYRFLFWGVPCALVVFGAIFYGREAKIWNPKIVVAIGDSSYTLYLMHMFIVPLITKIWDYFDVSRFLVGDILVLLNVTVCIVASHVAYLILEKPVTAYLSRIYKDFSSRGERGNKSLHQKNAT